MIEEVAVAKNATRMESDRSEKADWERWLPGCLLLLTLVFWAGLMAWVVNDARLQPQASGAVVAVFPRAMPTDEIYRTVLALDGRVVQGTWFNNIWLVHSDKPGFVADLQARGMLAGYSPLPFAPVAMGGCFLTPIGFTD